MKFSKILKIIKKYNNYFGVKVYRIPQISRGIGSRSRILLNYLSFLLSLLIVSPKFYFKKYDRIFVFAPSPVLVGLIALIISKFNNAKSCIWVLDLWPDILKELNIIRSNFLFSFFNFIINFMYKKFDIILVQSKSFKKIIEKKFKIKKKLYIFHLGLTMYDLKKIFKTYNKKNKYSVYW